MQKLWLWSTFRKPSHFCVKEKTCTVSISSPSCADRYWLRACTLLWLTILITSSKTLFSQSDIFWLATTSLWMKQCVDSHSEATCLIQAVKPKSYPVVTASPSMHMQTQSDQCRIFLICNQSKTWIVLQLWGWLATKVHITYPPAHPPEKYITQNQALLPCCQHRWTCQVGLCIMVTH